MRGGWAVSKKPKFLRLGTQRFYNCSRNVISSVGYPCVYTALDIASDKSHFCYKTRRDQKYNWGCITPPTQVTRLQVTSFLPEWSSYCIHMIKSTSLFQDVLSRARSDTHAPDFPDYMVCNFQFGKKFIFMIAEWNENFIRNKKPEWLEGKVMSFRYYYSVNKYREICGNEMNSFQNESTSGIMWQ